jgi:hypothetical protein
MVGLMRRGEEGAGAETVNGRVWGRRRRRGRNEREEAEEEEEEARGRRRWSMESWRGVRKIHIQMRIEVDRIDEIRVELACGSRAGRGHVAPTSPAP